MDKIYIKVDKKTGMVYLENTVIGRDKENLQQELIFSFENGFVLGSPRLEYKIGNNRYHIPMTREGESYTVPIKNVVTKEGKIEMQLVIVETEQDEEIPVFKSNVFYVYCNKSINAQEEPPEDYEYWLDVIEEKLAEVDEALDELDNVDIDASKTGSTATVSITNKEGITKSVEIYDGEDGAVGPQGPQGPQGPKGDKGDKGDKGTTDYEELENQPKVNNVTLIGNKTLSDLGIQPVGNYVTNTDYATPTVGGVIMVKDGDHGITVDEGVLKGTVRTYAQYNNMSSKGLVAKGTLENVITGKGLIDNTYHDSTKQNITDNNLTTTNKTIPTAINEVNSIAKGANQAVGYNNYSAMITALNAMDDDEYNVGQNVYIVTVNVPDLWVSSVESTSSTYTYVDDATVVNDLETNGYIQVGYYKLSMLETQKVDLTNYVTNTDYAGSNKSGVIRTNADYGTSITSVGALISATKTYKQYQDTTTNNMFISKGTLENVITGKGLVSNTDYATSSKGGVIKCFNSDGLNINNGTLITSVKTYAQYNSGGNWMFVGKGTLENVLNGKGLLPIVTLTQAKYDALATKDPDTYYYIVEE